MECHNPVQQKIHCAFEIRVQEGNSKKRHYQSFKVTASPILRSELKDSCLSDTWVSEKIDGTCTYIAEFEGRPWLWARHDRKPNKVGERKLKKFQCQLDAWIKDGKVGDKPRTVWDVLKDFKSGPENWIPAVGVPIKDDIPQPDEHGHIPGWVPVDPKSRTHCWHLTSVDLQQGLGLVLRESREEDGLIVNCVPLSDLIGQTAELIGSMVNSNPYKLGSKQKPVHLLVVHGSIGSTWHQPPDLEILTDWLHNSEDGKVEGIVWHCKGGGLFKLHRHHVNLPWPVENPRLGQQKVTVWVDSSKFELESSNNLQFRRFVQIDRLACDSLTKLHELFQDDS